MWGEFNDSESFFSLIDEDMDVLYTRALNLQMKGENLKKTGINMKNVSMSGWEGKMSQILIK